MFAETGYVGEGEGEGGGGGTLNTRIGKYVTRHEEA